MKPESLEDLNIVAAEAAKLYGQEFGNLPEHAQARWRDTVRETTPGREQTAMETCAVQALNAWVERQNQPTPEVPLEAAPETEVEEAPTPQPNRKSKKGE